MTEVTMRFAGRMAGLRTSEIREILKLTQRPEVISFAGGLPAAELFPAHEMAEVSAEVLNSAGASALQYSTTEGDPELRRAIAERMRLQLGVPVAMEQVLITSGSQQGLDLSGRLFLDDGDVVLCESPTYLGAINAFNAYRPRFVEVDTDDDGMVLVDLERKLTEHPRARMVYVIPDFQNPTGRSWSQERRQAFIELMARYDIPVIEDNPYSELCFEGEPGRPIKALDRRGQVVYLGTFSKIFCPGLRIGWLVAERSLYDRYVMVKQGVDLHTSTLGQRQIAAYIARFGLEANIERIRAVYRRRRDAMLATMDAEMPEGVRWTRPRGGLFLWVEVPECLDARELLAASLEEDVAFVPGGSFFPNGGHHNTMRLNFSAMPEARIVEGVRRLARVIGRALEAAADREPAALAETPA